MVLGLLGVGDLGVPPTRLSFARLMLPTTLIMPYRMVKQSLSDLLVRFCNSETWP